MSIINSILDLDQYKLSMQQAVLELFPDVDVEYRFKNRGIHRFTHEFVEALRREIISLKELSLTEEEYNWLKKNFTFFKPQYLEYLKNYRFNPKEVEFNLTPGNNLELKIKGKWHSTILFETILLSIISELYFKYIDTNWNYEGQEEKAKEKIKKLSENGCLFADFGTRRRRSYETQDLVVKIFCEFQKEFNEKYFVGTSNVLLAYKYNSYGIKAIGSVGHEWIQGTQILNSLNFCNYYAMENWIKVYSNVEIGTALTDTVGVDAFLKDFNRKQSMLYPSIRHDSGCPFKFIDKIIKHYEKMEINPQEKTIIFSDGLNVNSAIEIRKKCEGRIKCSFGIGTHFSNDFQESPALNIVIKLWSVNNQFTVKLSDIEGKENGDPEMVKIMKYIIKQKTNS